MERIKAYINYFLQLIIIVVLIYLLTICEKPIADNKYDAISIVGSIVLSILIGFVLDSERFLKEKNKHEQWKVNFKKLIIIAFPNFILSLALILYLNDILSNLFAWMFKISPFNYIIPSIVSGFTILNCFYKEKKEIE